MREQVKQGNFKGGVHEPARLSISPRDKRNIALAENPISQAMFRVRRGRLVLVAARRADRHACSFAQTFVFEEQVDYDFMMRALNDNATLGKKLRINGAQLKHGRLSRRDYPDAFSQEQVRAFVLAVCRDFRLTCCASSSSRPGDSTASRSTSSKATTPSSRTFARMPS